MWVVFFTFELYFKWKGYTRFVKYHLRIKFYSKCMNPPVLNKCNMYLSFTFLTLLYFIKIAAFNRSRRCEAGYQRQLKEAGLLILVFSRNLLTKTNTETDASLIHEGLPTLRYLLVNIIIRYFVFILVSLIIFYYLLPFFP